MNQQLTDLIDSLIATEANPTAWAWHEYAGDDSVYIDCSPAWNSATKAYSADRFCFEFGNGEDDAINAELTVDQLREIHKALTLQLAVIARQQA